MNHVVSDDLLLAIREAMGHASPPGILEEVLIADTIRLEQGGPCDLRRPYEEIVFYDLTIVIPSEDFQPLLAVWREAPLATSLGQDFYRFTSWPWQCLVVVPGQRTELLALLDTRAEQAERRATEFWANRESPQDILRAYHERRGVIIPHRPDKIDRFRS